MSFPLVELKMAGTGEQYAPRKRPNCQLCPCMATNAPGKLQRTLSTLFTNVAYFDRDEDSDDEDWKLWSKKSLPKQKIKDERWTAGRKEDDPNPPVFGHLTRYPEPVPPAHGIDQTEWENSGRTLIYNFKRNFTIISQMCISMEPGTDIALIRAKDRTGCQRRKALERGQDTPSTRSNSLAVPLLTKQLPRDGANMTRRSRWERMMDGRLKVLGWIRIQMRGSLCREMWTGGRA